MKDKTILAFVLRCVLLGCLALALTASVALADPSDPVFLYPGYYDANDYVKVVLHYAPDGDNFSYMYEVTNHSRSKAVISSFYFSSIEVTEVRAFWGWAPSVVSPNVLVGWGNIVDDHYTDYYPAVYPHNVPDRVGKLFPGVQIRWDAQEGGGLHVDQTVTFGFISYYAISAPVGDDPATANAGVVTTVGSYSNNQDRLYGPDPGLSPGGGSVPEWSSIVLGLIGFGGMGWRLRRR